jgi:F-box domain
MSVVGNHDLEAACSIASFEATTTATFRQSLQKKITMLLVHCKIPGDDGIMHYNAKHLASDLAHCFEWKNQCLYHDGRMARHACTAAEQDTQTTPLKEFIGLLLDPRVVPLAVSSSLLQVLVHCFLSLKPNNRRRTVSISSRDRNGNGTSVTEDHGRWTPSQHLLLQSITRIMLSRQCKDDLGSMITTAFKDHFDHLGRPCLDSSQSLLSLTRYCFWELEEVGRKEYCPLASLFPCLLMLLGTIMDSKNGLVDERSEIANSWCASCGRYIDRSHAVAAKKRRKGPNMDLVALHDGPLDTRQSWQHRQTDQSQPVFTLKAIMESKADTACPYCSAHITPREPGDNINVKAWCLIREKCIRRMISLFQSARHRSKQRAFRLLREAISDASCDNPFLRICILQLADATGKDGYGYLIWSLWNFTWERRNPGYLAWYAEIIVESSFCDDRGACWDALQPLVNSVRKRYADEVHWQFRCVDDLPGKLLLPCLGYVLSRRKRIFLSVPDSIKEEFESLVAVLAGSCGNAKYWFPESVSGPKTTCDNRTVRALQSLGILGERSLLLVSADSAKAVTEKKGPEALEQTRSKTRFVQWMDPKPRKLRDAFRLLQWLPWEPYERFSNRGIHATLLSDLDHDNKIVEAKEAPAALPVNHLDEDLLRNIFSFMGYKKLVKVRRVCKVFRELSDEDRLWLPLYRARFCGMLHNHLEFQKQAASTINTKVWKDHFKDKMLHQRDIRCGFTFEGKKVFRHCVCPHVGCTEVIRSQKHREKHCEWHQFQRSSSKRKRPNSFKAVVTAWP